MCRNRVILTAATDTRTCMSGSRMLILAHSRTNRTWHGNTHKTITGNRNGNGLRADTEKAPEHSPCSGAFPCVIRATTNDCDHDTITVTGNTGHAYMFTCILTRTGRTGGVETPRPNRRRVYVIPPTIAASPTSCKQTTRP